MPARLIRIEAVLARVALSRRTLLTLVARGEFPQPVRPSIKTVAWIESEVDGWIEAKIAARDGQVAA